MEEIAKRRKETEERIASLKNKLTSAPLVEGKACVYATGSFGRGESGSKSDLDLFIVGKTTSDNNGFERSALSDLDAICVKADLVNATRQLGIPDFDGDGKYLIHYSVRDFTKTLGTPDDDATNTFTARLLLLLESRPLLEKQVYEDVISDVIAAYWRDFEDHSSEFMPAFLANDILRLWRTFCVNYEARTERQPTEKKLKGKIKNYKLKHSRLLTCFSGLLYLLAVYGRKGTVCPTDAVEMTRLSPIGRLEWLRAQTDLADCHDKFDDLLRQYNVFLERTSNEELLIQQLANKDSVYLRSPYDFGDKMYEVLKSLGRDRRLHRLLVV